MADLNGYIIEKYNSMTGAYTCHRLVDEAKAAGVELQILGINDTVVREDGCYNLGKKLEKRDFVINRYKWGKMVDALNALGERTYNPHSAYTTYVNKYEQVKNLHSDAFLMPRYLLGKSEYRFDLLAEELGLPFVAKGLESSQGAEIYLIEDERDYRRLREVAGNEKEWLFEEYVKTSFGRDMRFYSIRGEVAACMIRKSQGDFRANVALGASVESYEITPEIRQIAKDVYAQTQLDFLGIDLLFGEEKPYFCEINVMPGLEGIEKASGVNVAGKIIETIKGDFR